jgi:hypothetical protein
LLRSQALINEARGLYLPEMELLATPEGQLEVIHTMEYNSAARTNY